MRPYRSLYAALFAAATLLPACGGDDPGTNFTITDDLDDSIYVYDFDEAAVAVRYFSATNSVVAVADSYNGLFSVGIIGQPIGADSFQVLGAAVDSNNNGNFLDETLILFGQRPAPDPRRGRARERHLDHLRGSRPPRPHRRRPAAVTA